MKGMVLKKIKPSSSADSNPVKTARIIKLRSEKADDIENQQTNNGTGSVVTPKINSASSKRAPFRCWVVLVISCVGIFLAMVSTTALIIAFPKLILDLQMTMTTMMWILLVVLLVVAAASGIVGKIGDKIGQAASYKFGYIIFLAASLGAGFSNKAHKGEDLLAARCAIGLGAAFLFINSQAILTNEFAPYGLVGLSQGLFQLTAAFGMVLGPVIGGAFAQTKWQWIFFFNLPIGGPCAILSLWAVRDVTKKAPGTTKHVVFDWVGAIFYPFGLVLLLIAMVQAIIPDPKLSKAGPLAGFVAGGCVAGIIFIADQFYAQDPIFPPVMFLNKFFTLSTLAGSCMAFVRNSITYNMIFYLQGPYAMDPLQAGIALIPYGIGIMIGGFIGGGLADKFGVREMTFAGPIITIVACSMFLKFDKETSYASIEGLLFLAGFGVGLFNSPNMMCNMLSVLPKQRGVASAMGILTLMFTSMIGIVLTFSLALNSMSQKELFVLFVYGGGALPKSAVASLLSALKLDYFVVIALCACSSIFAMFNNFKPA